MTEPPGWIKRLQLADRAAFGRNMPARPTHVLFGGRAAVGSHTLPPIAPPPPPVASGPDLPPPPPPVAPPPAPSGRAPDGRFIKGGAPGNPNGIQPKRAMALGELRKKARELSGRAIEVLEEIVNDEDQPGNVRVAACGLLLDRGYGKSVQPIEVGGPGAFETMTDEQLEAYCDDRAKMMLGITPTLD